MAKNITQEDKALLDALGVESTAKKKTKYTAKEERIIAGFEEIQRFVEEHGRIPQHGEHLDIFERLYAVRLDQIRASSECRQLLEAFDADGILVASENAQDDIQADDVSDSELLEALGVDCDNSTDLTTLKHVRPRAQINAADEVARREPCNDFEKFKAIFEQVQQELDNGERRTVKYEKNADVAVNDLFIVEGQKVLVESMDEVFVTDYERENRRLRVIYDNGTEANLLLRSLQRALYRSDNGRRITSPSPLFSDQEDSEDTETGFIYVLRSMSENPFIAENREVIHKIGVTKGNVKRRVVNAKKDPTFLLADVEIVITYKLAELNPVALERLLHKFFADARLDLKLKDRFGSHVEPREWFLVPLPMIQKAIDLLVSSDMERCTYDALNARIITTKTNDSV